MTMHSIAAKSRTAPITPAQRERIVPHDDTLSTDYSRTRKLAQRLEDLNTLANRGYELRHTHVFTHDDSEIYVDDLEKDLDDPR